MEKRRAADVVREVRTYVNEYNRGDFNACVGHNVTFPGDGIAEPARD